ncbi:sigma factor-like helix-turn-helix DNA-binding protein [Actinomadura sp. ATCC 39365]
MLVLRYYEDLPDQEIAEILGVARGTVRSQAARAFARPAVELWPEAVVKVPAKDSDGRTVRVVTGLSATEVLLVSESAFEKAGRLEVHDSASGTTRVLGDIPSPRKKYYPQLFTAGRGYIAWFGATPQDSVPWTDFWVMPAQGGKARRVGEVDADVDRIALTGDSLVWSVKEGGVYRMPLTGGAPERLPATDGLHLTAWPWAAGLSDDQPFANHTRAAHRRVRTQDPARRAEATARTDAAGRLVRAVQGVRPGPRQERRADRPAVRPDDGRDGPDRGTFRGRPVRERGLGGVLLRTVHHRLLGRRREVLRAVCERGCQVKTRGGGKEYTVLNLAAVPR